MSTIMWGVCCCYRTHDPRAKVTGTGGGGGKRSLANVSGLIQITSGKGQSQQLESRAKRCFSGRLYGEKIEFWSAAGGFYGLSARARTTMHVSVDASSRVNTSSTRDCIHPSLGVDAMYACDAPATCSMGGDLSRHLAAGSTAVNVLCSSSRQEVWIYHFSLL